jgi:mono/diheme cytochrome c family protein
MAPLTTGKAGGVAALAAVGALLAAFALGGTLRSRALAHSHQQPIAEQLFEPATPTSPVLVARGRTLFLDSCAHCHGADATGDEGPDLHDVQVSDRYIANIIRQGIPHEMPSFAKKHGAADITALTAFVRSLETGGG